MTLYLSTVPVGAQSFRFVFLQESRQDAPRRRRHIGLRERQRLMQDVVVQLFAVVTIEGRLQVGITTP